MNQVFEILVKWVETRDWEEALYAVIPKRKFATDGNKQPDGDGEQLEPDDKEVDEDRMATIEDMERTTPAPDNDGEKASA